MGPPIAAIRTGSAGAGEPRRTKESAAVTRTHGAACPSARVAAAVADATGVWPRYFRPPWGTFNWPAYVRAGQSGETRVLWSVRPEGLVKAAAADRMSALVVRKAHAGAIVNLHDHGGHPTTPRETWAALPVMITGLRSRGFDVVPLRALLSGDAGASHRLVP